MSIYNDRSLAEPVGALGRIRVDVGSRMKELDAGSMAASTRLKAKIKVIAAVVNLDIVMLFQSTRILPMVLPIDLEELVSDL